MIKGEFVQKTKKSLCDLSLALKYIEELNV